MAEKRILSIGYDIPGHSGQYHPFSASQSLLDADIIVFAPDLSDYQRDFSTPTFQGKPCYDNSSSFQIREHSQYWRKELLIALEAGKTVFVFLRRFEEIYLYSGEKQYSGTGRNARVTNEVSVYDNYRFIPVKLPAIMPRTGSQVTFSGHSAFASFWTRFKDKIEYESYLDDKVATPLFVTKTGGKPVGAMFKVGTGHLVLLPAMDYDHENFVKLNAKKEEVWTSEAMKFGGALISAIVEIDRSLQKGGEKTPPPEWVSGAEFVSVQEAKVGKEIADTDKRIEELQQRREKLLGEFEEAGRLKDLLFEKGKRLESAITLALRSLGYAADNYQDGTLELDHVIVSPEGERFVGEAEGKDTSAVNIDKFRQLAVNIQEDVQRPEVDKPAIGILFGNGFRLAAPGDRDEQFTEKCIKTAKGSNCVLVRTTDLYSVAKYVSEHPDEGFARKCREAVVQATGQIVRFPNVPALSEGEESGS